eukprot:CAMPEP_0172840972 /NCGR_PEP_ID=MMETSP1075-20121228/29694_1 /TAXON_ID=2916 /ORGANISM="Ceratium fusus, Strain PA161109" /LENGTH=137 /DNA_ID=CAMNT_0013684891 /DNA_START=228 /DNA_END=639 /DNA_ORIENTATION=+
MTTIGIRGSVPLMRSAFPSFGLCEGLNGHVEQLNSLHGYVLKNKFTQTINELGFGQLVIGVKIKGIEEISDTLLGHVGFQVLGYVEALSDALHHLVILDGPIIAYVHAAEHPAQPGLHFFRFPLVVDGRHLIIHART